MNKTDKHEDYARRLERLRTRSQKHYDKFVDTCRQYISLKREFERDKENFRKNIDRMVLLHNAYQGVRQNMTFNEELSDLVCDPVNEEKNIVNEVAESVVRILSGSARDVNKNQQENKN